MARIDITNLSVSFGGVQALRAVSFAAATSEIVGLIPRKALEGSEDWLPTVGNHPTTTEPRHPKIRPRHR